MKGDHVAGGALVVVMEGAPEVAGVGGFAVERVAVHFLAGF